MTPQTINKELQIQLDQELQNLKYRDEIKVDDMFSLTEMKL